MSLLEPVKRGDWVRATAKNGSVIEGQAVDDKNWIGLAAMTILVQGDEGSKPIEVGINVNFWTVALVRRNLL